MTEIKKSEELVAVVARQGVKMNLVEADIVLGYMEGHGYSRVFDAQYRVMLHDTEEEEKFGYTNDEPYSVREKVEKAGKSGAHVLTADDFAGVTFNSGD